MLDVTLQQILEDSASPQAQARDWLLNIDPAAIDPCTYQTVRQRYVLATLYFSTLGDSWNENDNWLSGTNECDWFNVFCDQEGALTILTLGKSTSLLSLPAYGISKLIFCWCYHSHVANNNLEGTVPDEMGVLDRAFSLDFSENNLFGPIPSFLKDLPSLRIYRSSFNLLSGTIPSFVGDLQRLEELEVRYDVVERRSVVALPTTDKIAKYRFLLPKDRKLSTNRNDSLRNWESSKPA